MTFALGSLGWTPRDFWTSTFYELSCAYVGYHKANGSGFTEKHWSAADKAAYEALKAKFPDERPPDTGEKAGI